MSVSDMIRQIAVALNGRMSMFSYELIAHWTLMSSLVLYANIFGPRVPQMSLNRAEKHPSSAVYPSRMPLCCCGMRLPQPPFTVRFIPPRLNHDHERPITQEWQQL
jgi:hypothetical protein